MATRVFRRPNRIEHAFPHGRVAKCLFLRASDPSTVPSPEPGKKRPGHAFRLAATRHGRAFFFARPLLTGTPDDQVVPDHGTAGRALPPVRIWPQVCATCNSGAWETRNPMLLLSFVGLSLLRLPDCRLLSLLLNDPPRSPRYEPLSRPGHPTRPSLPAFSLLRPSSVARSP